MATVGELEGKIAKCREDIAERNQKLTENLQHIEELEALQGRRNDLEVEFGEEQSRRKDRLFQSMSALELANRYSKNIISGYDTVMNDLLTGTEYANVVNSLQEASQTIVNKITQLQQENEELNQEINSLENKISQYQKEIEDIKRREREERAARAAQALREAQAALLKTGK